MARVGYGEGDWFAVPLEEGGYAIGVVARASRNGVMFGYFFGPRRDAVPILADAQGLAPEGAVLVGMFGDLGLLQGKWPVLGQLESWSRVTWPMPAFVRRERLTGRVFEVIYDDDDPNKCVSERQVAPGTAESGPEDGLMGAGFVEIKLTTATK